MKGRPGAAGLPAVSRTILWLVALMTGAGAALALALPTAGAPAAPLRVVTTLYPYASIVEAIGGEHVAVTHLLPAGASPHTFEPRPSQIRDVARAHLIVSNGAQLDHWIAPLIEAGNPGAERLVLAEGVALLPWTGPTGAGEPHHGPGHEPDHDHHGHHADDGHGHGAFDPHIWLDPILVRDVLAPRIAEALARLAPDRRADFEENLALFQQELDALDADIRRMLASVDRRRFISHHSAWRYFAARYGLEEAASISPSPGQEPSAQWLAQLTALSRELGVTTVLAEPQLNPQAAQIIAEEIGGQVLLLDPLGGPSLPGRSTYTELLRFNARMLAEALGDGSTPLPHR